MRLWVVYDVGLCLGTHHKSWFLLVVGLCGVVKRYVSFDGVCETLRPDVVNAAGVQCLIVSAAFLRLSWSQIFVSVFCPPENDTVMKL